MTRNQPCWHQLFRFVEWAARVDRTPKTIGTQEIFQSRHWRSHLISWLALGGVLFVSPHCAIAQRIPIADDSLGNERSLVSPNTVIDGLPSNQIDGGAQRGANLFHSFREFNIDAGRGVYFTNPAGVANILTRVTGSNRSEILGTLGVLGNANLFLLNPNGILFGSNAQLDVGGSFVSSTANSIVFANGFAFSATNPQAPPLLTIDVPIGLQYGSNPGAIQSQGASLQVPDGQTLTLAGGTVNVEGIEGDAYPRLYARGGRVELAGVAAPGEVRLTQQGQEWRLSLPEGLARADVSITNGATVSVRLGGGGSIAINARNVNILGDESKLLAGILTGLGSVGAKAGDIDINATQAVNVAVGGGVAGGIYNRTNEGSVGDSGNVNITTGSLTVTGDGARIETNVYGKGNTGNVIINARDSVTFDGEVAAISTLEETGNGKGGNIIINTRSLRVLEGAGLNASTYGEGNGGNVIVNARDSVTIDGVSSRYGFSTGISTFVAETVNGQGGNIIINTGSLRVTGGAALSASTYGEGNGGNLIINARDTAIFAGVASNGVISRATSTVAETGKGIGGNINITTGSLSITNGAELSASSEGQGNAGNLDVTARQLRLDNKGSIQAQTTSGQGGNIRLQVQDFLLLQQGSLISTNAGTAQAGGNGGNITFNGDFIVAVPKEDSDISANAYTGNGGRVEINAQGIFGIEFRPRLTPLSDITASSDFGAPGVVAINTPNVDPNRGLVQLPVDVTDASRLIVQTCPTGNTTANQSNEFVVTGRGGLPPTPSEAVNRDAIQVDLVTADAQELQSVSPNQPSQSSSPHTTPPTRFSYTPLVEAQSWQLGADGRVVLVAAAPTKAIAPSLNRLAGCRTSP